MATARGSAAGAAQASDAASRPLAVAQRTEEVALTDAAPRPGGHQGPSECPGRARDTRGRALCGRAAPVRANGHHTHVGGPGQRPGLRAEAGGRRTGGRAGHARHRSRRARVHAERWQGPRRPEKGLLRAPGPAGPRKTEQQDAAPRQPYTLGQDERGGGPGTAPSDSTSSSTEKWVTPQPQAPTRVPPAAVTSRAALDAELPEARPPPPTSPRQSSRD